MTPAQRPARFAALILGCALAGQAVAQPVPAGRADFALETASPEARRLADWVVRSQDMRGLPFIIVDKTAARVFAFDPLGRVRGAVPALLGLARGDRSPADIGTRRLADITPQERITPAGRFEARLGQNLAGQDILWVDYAAAISLHRVVTGTASEHRLQRLATPPVTDNRVSYGCINVPVRFYEQVVQPLFGPADGIVYIMPEAAPVETMFPLDRAPAVRWGG